MRKLLKLSVCAASLVLCSLSPALSQNYSPPGNSWSGGWGFRSATDKSVGFQRATAIRNAEKQSGPSTVVNTTNYYNTDNRSNYVDVDTTGDVSTDYQIGDDIGQNTNSVGSMNTGTTNIDIVGNDNSIVAENSADNSGCVDGSALTNSMGLSDGGGSLGLSDLVNAGGTMPGFSSSYGNVASPFQDCTR